MTSWITMSATRMSIQLAWPMSALSKLPSFFLKISSILSTLGLFLTFIIRQWICRMFICCRMSSVWMPHLHPSWGCPKLSNSLPCGWASRTWNMQRSIGVLGDSTQLSRLQAAWMASWTASGSSPPPMALSPLVNFMASGASVKSCISRRGVSMWSWQATTPYRMVMPSILTLSVSFSMRLLMVDLAWASSELIDPVASRQKQMSMYPQDEVGSMSRDDVLYFEPLGSIVLPISSGLFPLRKVVADVSVPEEEEPNRPPPNKPPPAGTGPNNPAECFLGTATLAGFDLMARLTGRAVFLAIFFLVGLRLGMGRTGGTQTNFLVVGVRLVLRKSFPSAMHQRMELVFLSLLTLGADFLFDEALVLAMTLSYYTLPDNSPVYI